MVDKAHGQDSPSDWIPLVVVFGLVLILVLVVAYVLMCRVCVQPAYVQVVGQSPVVAPQPKMQGEVNGKIENPPVPDDVLLASVYQDRDGSNAYTDPGDDPPLAVSPFIAKSKYLVKFDRLNTAPQTFFLRVEGPGVFYEDEFTCTPGNTTCTKTVDFP